VASSTRTDVLEQLDCSALRQFRGAHRLSQSSEVVRMGLASSHVICWNDPRSHAVDHASRICWWKGEASASAFVSGYDGRRAINGVDKVSGQVGGAEGRLCWFGGLYNCKSQLADLPVGFGQRCRIFRVFRSLKCAVLFPCGRSAHGSIGHSCSAETSSGQVDVWCHVRESSSHRRSSRLEVCNAVVSSILQARCRCRRQ